MLIDKERAIRQNVRYRLTIADQMETINLNRLAYFAAVIDAGSFTRAADRLGITKTVVSQQVAKLEAELRTSLLLRTTRRVEPTEAGRRLYARCIMIFREAQDAVGEIVQTNAEPIGILRITAPHDFGASTIAPLVASFTRKYPACGVDLILADTKMDLVANQIDLSIRVGWLDDSSHQAKRIGSFRQVLVASDALAEVISAAAPEELAGLPFIANQSLREPLQLRFSRDQQRRTVRMRQAIGTNSTPAALAATLAGGGISVLPDFEVAEHIKAGRLAEILSSWRLPSGGIYVVYPAARFRPSKVTSFVAMLTDGTHGAQQGQRR